MKLTFTINSATGFLAFTDETETEEVDLVESVEVEAADDAPPNPVLPVMPEIIWSAACFFALWGLLKFVLLPPIIAGRDERRAKAQASKDAVANTEANLMRIRAEHDAEVASAKTEAAQIIDAARAEADAERVQAMAAVDAEIVKLRSGATTEIDQARAAAMSGARADVDNLAVAAASKVLGKNLDVSANKSILDSIIGS